MIMKYNVILQNIVLTEQTKCRNIKKESILIFSCDLDHFLRINENERDFK